MDHLLSLLVGVAMLVVVFVDLLWTSLWVSGTAGPLTDRLSSAAWRSALRVTSGRRQQLSLFGPVSLVGAVVLWSALLWLGWAFIFAADPGSIRDADTGTRADGLDRLYFTGYAVFTMGNGDLEPIGYWRLATVLMNASGIILLTLVVSYLFSVVSSVVRARSFAARVRSMADSPQDLASTGASQSGAQALGSALAGLSVDLLDLSQHHLAYPVMRYYYASDERDAAPVSAMFLSDSLVILRALPVDRRPADVELRQLEGALERYTEAMAATPGTGRAVPPPLPPIDALEQAGATVERPVLEAEARRQADLRARLRAATQSLGRSWPAW